MRGWTGVYSTLAITCTSCFWKWHFGITLAMCFYEVSKGCVLIYRCYFLYDLDFYVQGRWCSTSPPQKAVCWYTLVQLNCICTVRIVHKENGRKEFTSSLLVLSSSGPFQESRFISGQYKFSPIISIKIWTLTLNLVWHPPTPSPPSKLFWSSFQVQVLSRSSSGPVRVQI